MRRAALSRLFSMVLLFLCWLAVGLMLLLWVLDDFCLKHEPSPPQLLVFVFSLVALWPLWLSYAVGFVAVEFLREVFW